MKKLKTKILYAFYRFFKKQLVKDKINSNCGDIKCSNCDTWYSESSIDYTHKMSSLIEIKGGEMISTFCGRCKHTDYWRPDLAPVLISCDSKGIPN